ncbi:MULTISPECIES: peptide deformylase [unclassified Chryseobacterium]|uniref:peptide deformylase n=1 Tax=unclassified Chryseobacterium TaxID=2593645 RepID=UPI00100A2655|nr:MULTISPECIES: peptide deformylase [unclassified Chryseobacterium]RXM53400.1 peptide deformylase [Chryseobacterium sp. CH25]RXM65397.1 peptide deformylase [Chryseobacterium sp. CH1]
MNLPIVAYGNRILKQKCIEVNKNSQEIHDLIVNMWETMENSNGCGLSSSQINKPLQLFIVDSQITFENLDIEDQLLYFERNDKGIRETFINAKIISTSEESWVDYEGCLSIPGLSQKVERPWGITIEYLDQNFNRQTKTFTGLTARIIQHEYDHTQGVLYIYHLKPLTRKMIESKLKKIVHGNIKTGYPMTFL